MLWHLPIYAEMIEPSMKGKSIRSPQPVQQNRMRCAMKGRYYPVLLLWPLDADLGLM